MKGGITSFFHIHFASWSLNATTNCLRTHGPWTEVSLAVPAPVFKAVVW